MKRFRLAFLLLALVATACGGGGGSTPPVPSGGGSTPKPGATATPTPGATATPTPGATATPTPSPVPTATPTATPTPTPTASPASTNACLQTPSPSATPGLSNVSSTFYSSILPNARNICLSAWDLSSDVDTALLAAARNGANVWVVAPYSQHGSNSSDASSLVAAGAHFVDEYTGSSAPASMTGSANETSIHSPMDIHAKFALVDGVGYMDGHNWFTSDVVMRTGDSADFLAMQNDLANFPTPPGSNGPFTTDKQLSLKGELDYMNSQTFASGDEYDFITESFNATSSNPSEYNDDVYAKMCAIATTHATVKVMVESKPSGSDLTYLQNLEVIGGPTTVVKYDYSGHEKISMKRGASSAWFGSSNLTTTDLFDWGYTLSDPGVISALGTYFDSEFNGATAMATPAPGTSAISCP